MFRAFTSDLLGNEMPCLLYERDCFDEDGGTMLRMILIGDIRFTGDQRGPCNCTVNRASRDAVFNGKCDFFDMA